MSSANAFVSHALRYIVDYKQKYIHTIYSPSSGVL